MRRGATASSRLYPVVGCTREKSCCSWDSNPPRPFLHLSHTYTQAQSAAATVAAAWWCRHSPDGVAVLDTPSSRNPFKNVSKHTTKRRATAVAVVGPARMNRPCVSSF
ncbi:hypothetical protein Tco_0506205 [Tanacetum coccineum]